MVGPTIASAAAARALEVLAEEDAAAAAAVAQELAAEGGGGGDVAMADAGAAPKNGEKPEAVGGAGMLEGVCSQLAFQQHPWGYHFATPASCACKLLYCP